jgi:hypothetical protein
MGVNQGDMKELLEQYKSDFPVDYRERLMRELEIAIAKVELFQGALMLDGERVDGE